MKLTVVGAGTIGAGVAYNVAVRDLVDEVMLVDIDAETAEGEALDIAHAVSHHADVDVYQGGYDDAGDSDVVAITAGKPRKEGMTRTDLLEANIPILRDIFSHDFGDDPVFVTTTNPMDVVNYANSVIADYPRERFIGFGGWLDAARARYVVADHLDVSPAAVDIPVIGEHGDSQVPVFSRLAVGGEPHDLDPDTRGELQERMAESAMDVISRKGYTQWAPTRGVSEVVRAVVEDPGDVIPCSAVLDGAYGRSDLSIGVPVRLGRSGIAEVVEWELSGAERDAFDGSADKLADLCAEADDLL